MNLRWLLVTLPLAACGDNLSPPAEPGDTTPLAPTCDEADLPNTLQAIEHVTSVAEQPCGDFVLGTPRCFLITFEQPIHPGDDSSKTFQQRLFLTHRGCDRPAVVADWGYSNDQFFDDELASTFATNALWIEHRYQGESLPEPADWDWTALTIENGANDVHAVITAFRKHYGGRFVTTGASKGGITATYHKYFFPHDADGSIPYVAPASRARVDPEYQTQLDARMPNPCAQKLRDAQVAALTSRRTMMLGKLASATPGSEPLTLEYITESLDWAFWQYYGVGFCNRVPSATTSDDNFYNFFASFSGLSQAKPAAANQQMSDGALYYEWLTEQGFALQVGAHVRPLLHEPSAQATMEDDFHTLFPAVDLPAYDGTVTLTVRRWARNFADDLLLIYGEFDPWSVGGSMDASIRESSARFFVPGATHGAQMRDLDADDHAAAMAIASRLIGHGPLASKRDQDRAADIQQAVFERRMQLEQSALLRMKRTTVAQ